MQASTLRLWRYNFSILIGGGYWILVLPVAASQVVTLWMMALSGDFSQPMATLIAELMTPILGAFLAAHALAPEYRSGVGAVLACKPVSLHRVVTLRVGLALLTALLLTSITLGVCNFGLKPIEMGPALLAAIPPLWFLSLLALTAATLFRSSLGGFAVAAAVWVVDLALGYSVNPFFSSRGLHAVTMNEPLSDLWAIGKGVLLVAGTVLLFVHHRMMVRLCRAPERKDVIRLVATAAGVALFYCVSGAVANLSYAYAHRGSLLGGDSRWIRKQLAAYGPLPVARLFGPALAAFVEEPPVSSEGEGTQTARIKRLEQALQRWPKDIWAQEIAFELGKEQETPDPPASVRAYFKVADQYPDSPLAPLALTRIFRAESEAVAPLERLTAARRTLADYPSRQEAERAAEYLLNQDAQTVNLDERTRAAQIATRCAPNLRAPFWHATLADLYRQQGKNPEAAASAQEAIRLGRELRERASQDRDLAMEIGPNQAMVDQSVAMAEKVLQQVGK